MIYYSRDECKCSDFTAKMVEYIGFGGGAIRGRDKLKKSTKMARFIYSGWSNNRSGERWEWTLGEGGIFVAVSCSINRLQFGIRFFRVRSCALLWLSI